MCIRDSRVTFELKDHNAKEDENYIVTTKTLLIPAGQETMNFEFKTVDAVSYTHLIL